MTRSPGRARRWIRGAAATVLPLLGLAYAAPFALLWGFQEALLFPAPGLDRTALDARAARRGAQPVTISTADGVSLYAWVTPGPHERLVVYFHGNGSTPSEAWRLQSVLAPRGIGLLAITYRGYPPSEGEPSERGLHEDARAAWRYATEELGVPPERVLLHGRSLGGGVAAALAAEVDAAALVVEASFTSIRDVAQGRYPIYPVGLALRHRFDTAAIAGQVEEPVLIVHGDRDSIVPVTHGQRLAELFPRARYVEVPGQEHNDPLLLTEGAPLDAYHRLLDEVTGTSR